MFVALQSYGTCLIIVKIRVKTEAENEQDTKLLVWYTEKTPSVQISIAKLLFLC